MALSSLKMDQIKAEAKRRGLESKSQRRRESSIRRDELARPLSVRAATPETRFPTTKKSRFKKFTDAVDSVPVAQMAGSILGEQIGIKGGAKLGAKFGPVGAALGAGLGGVAGLLVDSTAKGKRPSAIEQSAEFAAGAVGVPLGGVTKRLARPVRSVFEPFLSTLSTGAKAVDKNLRRYGESLMFSQATTSKAFNVAENVSRAALSTVSSLENKLVRQSVATEKYADEILGFFKSKPRSDAEIGNLFTISFVEKESFNKGVAEASYAFMDKISKSEAVVDYDKIASSLKSKSVKAEKFFNAVLRNRKIDIGILSGNTPAKGKLFGDPVLKDTGRGLTFLNAKKLRTDYLEFARRMKGRGSIGATEMAEINDVIGVIDSEMEKAAKKGGWYKEWRNANDLYTNFREDFHNEMISKLAKQDPSVIGKKVSQIQTVEDVMRLKRVISPSTLKDVQASYLADVAERASSITQGLEERGTRQLQGDKLKKIIKLDRREQSVRKALFGKDAAKLESNLRLLADQAFLVQEKQSSGLGGMAVQLAQARALTAVGAGTLGLLTGGPAIGAGVGATVFLGPVGLQKLLMSKKGMSLLLDGLHLETGTSEATRAVTRLAIFLGIPRSELTTEEVLEPQQQARLQTRNPRAVANQ